MLSIIHWWVGKDLPTQHINIKPEDKPKEFFPLLKLYVLRWLIHPVKRRLAKYYLEFLRKLYGLKVVGITGSAGKTSTKEMLASILKQAGKTVYSYANIDPVYNIPATILRCTPQTRFLILEMGVEYPGEIDFYLWLAKPDLGIITNIYPTHTLFFGDAGGVFKEKSKLVKNLPNTAAAILNVSDKKLVQLRGNLGAKIVWFGTGGDVAASREKIGSDGRTNFLLHLSQNSEEPVKVFLPIPGLQFVQNALAAAAAAQELGIKTNEIKAGLEKFAAPEHRMKIIKHKSGAILLDDSYNNNPSAAKGAIETFMAFAGKKEKVIVFGDMLELGSGEKRYHQGLGETMGKLPLRKLVCVGKLSKITAEVATRWLGQDRVVWVPNVAGAMNEVRPVMKQDVVILVKGSRSIGLDKLVDSLS